MFGLLVTRHSHSVILKKDESSKKPEMKLTIPEILKVQLVDDWECCTKNNQVKTMHHLFPHSSPPCYSISC